MLIKFSLHHSLYSLLVPQPIYHGNAQGTCPCLLWDVFLGMCALKMGDLKGIVGIYI